MTYYRAVLVALQGVAYQLASTPPNETPQKARFDANHPWYIRIAPTVMKVQAPIIWLCALSELSIALAKPLTAISTPAPSLRVIPNFLYSHRIYTTPMTIIGASLVVFGSLLRLTCFRTLGQLFTFDLTILPKHILVKSGPYAYVRHPAYTGSLSMILGLALVNLTPGSWLSEAGILGRGQLGIYLRAIGGAMWWLWWLAVGVKRCRAEDAELQKTFGKEWEDYANQVRYWFVPGLI
ncbi:hypothetical protein BDY19DRAFT_313708 [Irpex rosettiformis]|uniref:Uncharacterized protein n=1 Tax=Irpex rosettiformis TaxID=378272 RepID=A0ACB8TXV7_9APHY|nr:hypothetical protein BDY19DRAFT_313708 [Irpex rosettiformis]